MKRLLYFLLSLFRVLTIVLVVYSVAIQPAIYSLGLLDKQATSLIEIDLKKESSEKENEENNMDEKIELQLLNPDYNHYNELPFQNSHIIQINFKSLTVAIPSPPPDLA